MTNEDYYIEKHTTVWDRVMFYSWVPALASIFVVMVSAALGGDSIPWVIVFLFWFLVLIVCRSVLGAKVERLKREYYESKKL